MVRKSIFILAFLVSTFCLSQEREFLLGQLVDSTQNAPIPFATIKIKDKALGVISNIDGTFKIPWRYIELSEVLEISCMGYLTKELHIQDLNASEGNIIILKPGAFELKEAVVSANIKKLSAEQIVRIAVNSIPQNYPDNKFALVGYYRDYQIKNENYINLNEAIIRVMDKGFKRKNNFGNDYHLYSYAKNSNFEVDTFAGQPYDYKRLNKIVPSAKMENDGGNEFITLIAHNAIRNYGIEMFSFVDDISTDFIKNHSFFLRRKTNFKNESVHEIDLVYLDDHYIAKGTIFINSEDFAIHKFDYALYVQKKSPKIKMVTNPEERLSNGFTKTDVELMYRIKTEYVRHDNDKMFLNYISFYNKVLIQRPAEFESKFTVNLADNSFRVRMNKIPAKLDKIKNGDFKVSYSGKLIPINEFYFLEDERTFVVCPNLKYKYVQDIIDRLFTKTSNLQIEDLKYAYSDIEDSEGNKLDERKWEYIHQYREFFTQEIDFNSNDEMDAERLMIKTEPLDSPYQPIHEEKVRNVYWKNTPLPNLSN